MTRIGTDVLLFVNMVAPPGVDLQVIACQRDATFTENTAVVDVSCKAQREQRVLGGRYSAEITMDSLYVADDDAYEELVDANRTGEPIMVARLQNGLVFGIGEGVVTSLSERFPDQAESTVSATIVIDEMLDTSTQNLVINPKFEDNVADGWNEDDVTAVRDTSDAVVGAASADVETDIDIGIGGHFHTDNMDVTGDTHVAVTVSVLAPTAGDEGNTCRIVIREIGGVAPAASHIIEDVVLTNAWQEVGGVHEIVENDRTDVQLWIYPSIDSPTIGDAVLIDRVQVEALPYRTPYCDGDQGPGHVWDDPLEPNNSTSSRA